MDPDNIFQILMGNSPAGGQSNVLQGMAPQPRAPQEPTPAADIAQAAVAASPPTPKPRRSLIDTIGRISDVFAKVGGAEALYQPTLDAREKHGFDVQDHGLKVDEATIKNATDKFDLGDKHNARLGQAARGLKAIQAAGGDINQAWPVLAQRMQLDPDTISSVGQALASDPHALDGLIGAATDPKYDQSKYSGSVVYAKGPDGKIVAFQPSLSNDGGRSILPDGYSAIEPSKVLDLGGSAAVVGNSGERKVILPKTAKPDTILTTTTSRQNNRDTNQTNLTIAGMPARSKDGPGTAKGGDANVPTLLNNIEQGFNDLHGMKALPGEGSGVGQLEGIIGRSALGQKAGEQLGMPAAQKRLEIMKNVSALQQAMLKSLPASATRTKFEQEMLARGLPDPSKMSLKTAQTVIGQLRQSYAEAVATLNKSAPAPKKVQPAGGWGTATVVHGG